MQDQSRKYFDAIDQFSRQIKLERERQNLSQEEVARRAGISLFTYSGLERLAAAGGTLPNPKLETVLKIMWALGINENHDLSAKRDGEHAEDEQS